MSNHVPGEDGGTQSTHENEERIRRSFSDLSPRKKLGAALAGASAIVFSAGTIDNRPAFETLGSDPLVAVEMAGTMTFEAAGYIDHPLSLLVVGGIYAVSRARK